MSFIITEEKTKICNLWFGKTSANQKVLISYRTIVGWFNTTEKVWELTTHSYSVTTTKQLNKFAKENKCIWVDELPESVTVHDYT